MGAFFLSFFFFFLARSGEEGGDQLFQGLLFFAVNQLELEHEEHEVLEGAVQVRLHAQFLRVTREGVSANGQAGEKNIRGSSLQKKQ